jgi:hypothetical protein
MADIPSTSSPLAQSSRRALKRTRSGSPTPRPRLFGSKPERVPSSAKPAPPETEHLETQTAEINDAHFDKAVLSSMAMIGWEAETSGPLNLGIANHLLECIAIHSDDQLDPKFKNAVEAAKFLKNHGEVFDQLKVAWEKKTFVEIRQHGKRPTFRFRSTFQSRLISLQSSFAPKNPFTSPKQILINIYMAMFKVSHPCHPTFALY